MASCWTEALMGRRENLKNVSAQENLLINNVRKLIASIENQETSLKSTGLYRVPGKEHEAKELCKQISENSNTVIKSDIDTNIACSALKKYVADFKIIDGHLFNILSKLVHATDDEGFKVRQSLNYFRDEQRTFKI